MPIMQEALKNSGKCILLPTLCKTANLWSEPWASSESLSQNTRLLESSWPWTTTQSNCHIPTDDHSAQRNIQFVNTTSNWGGANYTITDNNLTNGYNGCFSPLWIALLGQHHPQINGLHYMVKIVTLIWQAVLKVWAVQNAHLHPHNHEQEDHSQLHAAVNQIIYEASQDPLLHAMVENFNPEQLLAQPTHQIRQWVTHSHDHMQAHSKVVKLQARLHTHDICEYFPQHKTPNSTDKNLLHPP